MHCAFKSHPTLLKCSDAPMLWLKYASQCVLTFGPVSAPDAAPGICSDFSFKCKNKECVNKVNAECDRVNDCADHSDEAGCGKLLRFFFPFSKTAESGSHLFNVTQIDGWAARWAGRWKRAPGPECFIYFILLWKQLLSCPKFLFFISILASEWIFFFLISQFASVPN